MSLRQNDPGRLIPGEVESVNVHAVYVDQEGWHLTISIRRQFQTWGEASRGIYDHMSTPEMVCVLDAALATELKV